MEKPNYNFDTQRLYLEMFLSDAETFVRCQNIYDPENFDRRLQPIAKFILDYVDNYKVMPETKIVNATCNSDLETVKLPPENYNWLMDEFEHFSRHRSLERAILKSADLLEKGEYGPVERLIRDAIQISLNKDLGTDYFENPRARLEHLKNSNGQISTGWPTMDRRLYGGFNRGELSIFAAASGGGKSLFLANLAVNWALTGLNVIYLTFELAENLVAMRVDSMLTGISTREIFRNIDDVELRVKMTERKAGNIQIKYLPSGKNCNDIRAYLKEYQVKKGYKPDIILIDYLDLMMPISIKVSPSDLFVKDKYVSEEIRNLAMETNCITVTASQLNRSAVEEIEFDHSHIAGGLSKIQTADNVIGIFTSRAMRERGKYQIQFMKTRSSSGVGQKIDLDFNIETLRITDPGEDENTNSTNQTVTNPLRRTSLIRSTSTQTTETTPSKEQQRANNIRSILANLNQERD